MNFTNLTTSTTCSCLNGAKLDTTSLFARKVGKAKSLKDRDFKSYAEKGREFNDKIQSCANVCGILGLSIDIWNDKSKEDIINRYKTTSAFSPKLKNHLSILKFKENSGKVKHTPVKEPTPNKHHFDFYKSDEFVLDESIELVELIPLIQSANV